MADTTAADRQRRYRLRQREKDREALSQGKLRLGDVLVTPQCHGLLTFIAGEHYGGDMGAAVEEATRLLHAKHYRPAERNVMVTAAVDPPVRYEARRVTRLVQVERDQRRQDLAARSRELYAAGESLGAIARRFNEEGIPTLSGGGIWRHKAIRELLNAVLP